MTFDKLTSSPFNKTSYKHRKFSINHNTVLYYPHIKCHRANYVALGFPPRVEVKRRRQYADPVFCRMFTYDHGAKGGHLRHTGRPFGGTSDAAGDGGDGGGASPASFFRSVTLGTQRRRVTHAPWYGTRA